MALFRKKQCADPEAEKLKSFLDMIAPSLVKFEFDRYFCGNSIRCVWALRGISDRHGRSSHPAPLR